MGLGLGSLGTAGKTLGFLQLFTLEGMIAQLGWFVQPQLNRFFAAAFLV